MKARVTLAALAIAALALGPGCKGDTGAVGPPGPGGPAGDAGPPGNPAITKITIPSNSQTPSDADTAAWAALQPQVTVQSVTIASPPVVKFTVTDQNGIPIAGLGNISKSSTATVASYPNLAFALAKLVPGSNGSPSKWVSYIVTTVPTTTAGAAPTRPTTDSTGTLVDNGDGTYAYTFYRDVKGIKDQIAAMDAGTGNNVADLGDLTFDGTLVHRVTVAISGNAPGTGTNTPNAVQNVTGVPMQHPIDFAFDFTPSTGQATPSGREITATAKCNECHRVLGGIPGDPNDSSSAAFHGGNRNNVQYCVVCHTAQRKYGQATATYNASTLTITSASSYRFGAFGGDKSLDRAIGDLPNMMHHFHAGPVLAYKGYNYANVLFNDILFPQDLRNCTKCHDGSDNSTAKTAEGDNWKKVPNRLACGGCHDGIDFATGQGVTLRDAAAGLTSTTKFNGLAHGGFAQADDSRCVLCHSPAGVDIDLIHRPVTPPNSDNALLPHTDGGTGNGNTNAAWIASNPARLPTGAIAVTYDVKSVSLNGNRNPVMVFRWLQNGQRKDLNVFDPANPVAKQNPATGAQEMWPNFMGSPSAQFVYALPQDGIKTPSDYNASARGYLRAIWNGTGTGTGAGTLSGPDSNGYYTVTLTGVTLPASAVMLTGGMGYSYAVSGSSASLPLTQTAAADGTPFKDEAGAPVYPVWASGTTDTTVKCVVPANAKSPACNGGLVVIAPNAQKVATGCPTLPPGQPPDPLCTGRRPIVEDARCNACHQELGTFTEDAFHAGQRNDGTTCSWCHTPNVASSGWSADSTYFVHAIHAGAKRDVKYTWDAPGPATSLPDGGIAAESFADIEYPGVLRDCQTCHLPNTYDFSATASANALPNKQLRVVATGAYNGIFNTTTNVGGSITNYSANCTASASSTQTALGFFELAPYVATVTAPYPAVPPSTSTYGIGYSFNAGASASTGCTPDGKVYTIPAGSTPDQGDTNARDAYGASLVNSPIAGVCSACHDSPAALAHFEQQGGSIYEPRSSALKKVESCLICHGTGQIADIAQVHKP
jgi:OmcA/MtrC family decaheme c-type cytochrome